MLNKGITFGLDVELRRHNGETHILEVPVGAASMAMDSTAEIKTSLKLSSRFGGEINWYYDKVVPFLTLNRDRQQLGEFVIVGAALDNDYWNFDCFDNCQIVRRKKTESRIFFPAGTPYTEAVGSLIQNAGVQNYYIAPYTGVLQTDREDWEPTTSHLTIANALLAEMNYYSLYARADGWVMAMPKRLATVENITKVYNSHDVDNILIPGGNVVLDTFDHPNIFLYRCENPDLAEPLMAYSENNSKTNRHSIINAPRNPVERTVDNVATQEALQQLADYERYESMISSDNITFETGLAVHDPFEIVALNKDIFEGIIEETGWSMDLSVGGLMTHKGKRADYT